MMGIWEGTVLSLTWNAAQGMQRKDGTADVGPLVASQAAVGGEGWLQRGNF